MSFYRGRIFAKIHQFPSDWFFSFVRKKIVLRTIYLHFSKMSNIEHRAVIKFSTRKGLNATEISKELDNVYKDSAPSYRTVAKWVAEFKDPEPGFEDSPRTGRPSTVTTAENIEAVERIVMRDRQISVRHVAYELGMKKVSTRWVPKLLTPIQRTNRVDCCQELLQESEESPTKFYDRIVTGDET
jgi:transposase